MNILAKLDDTNGDSFEKINYLSYPIQYNIENFSEIQKKDMRKKKLISENLLLNNNLPNQCYFFEC